MFRSLRWCANVLTLVLIASPVWAKDRFVEIGCAHMINVNVGDRIETQMEYLESRLSASEESESPETIVLRLQGTDRGGRINPFMVQTLRKLMSIGMAQGRRFNLKVVVADPPKGGVYMKPIQEAFAKASISELQTNGGVVSGIEVLEPIEFFPEDYKAEERIPNQRKNQALIPCNPNVPDVNQFCGGHHPYHSEWKITNQEIRSMSARMMMAMHRRFYKKYRDFPNDEARLFYAVNLKPEDIIDTNTYSSSPWKTRDFYKDNIQKAKALTYFQYKRSQEEGFTFRLLREFEGPVFEAMREKAEEQMRRIYSVDPTKPAYTSYILVEGTKKIFRADANNADAIYQGTIGSIGGYKRIAVDVGNAIKLAAQHPDLAKEALAETYREMTTEPEAFFWSTFLPDNPDTASADASAAVVTDALLGGLVGKLSKKVAGAVRRKLAAKLTEIAKRAQAGADPEKISLEIAQAVADSVSDPASKKEILRIIDETVEDKRIRESLKAQFESDPQAALTRMAQSVVLAVKDPKFPRALNSRGMAETFQTVSAAAQRSGEKVSVIVFDLANFKTLNDTLGHLPGDHALKEFIDKAHDALERELADAVGSQTRPLDVFGDVARPGGDEFVVIARAGAEGANRLKNRIESFFRDSDFIKKVNEQIVELGRKDPDTAEYLEKAIRDWEKQLTSGSVVVGEATGAVKEIPQEALEQLARLSPDDAESATEILERYVKEADEELNKIKAAKRAAEGTRRVK